MPRTFYILQERSTKLYLRTRHPTLVRNFLVADCYYNRSEAHEAAGDVYDVIKIVVRMERDKEINH